MIEVEYFGNLDNGRGNLGLFELDLLLLPPTPALKYINSSNKLDSFKCPAITGFLKNIYFILSPFDFTIVKQNNGYTIVNDRDPEIDLSQFLIVGYPESKTLSGQPMLSILLQYSFTNKSNNLTMSVIDPPLTPNPLTNMPGEFNISKWPRPTNFCFFLNPDCETISFKRGEPLYAVRFNTEENIKLKFITDEKQRLKIMSEQQRAGSLKNWYPKLSLNQCYELFSDRIKGLWK
jgi:hypothetical protein